MGILAHFVKKVSNCPQVGHLEPLFSPETATMNAVMKLPKPRPIVQVRRIDGAKVTDMTEKLSARINERFPQSGLADVARQTATISADTITQAARLSAPRRWLRLATVVGCLIVVVATTAVAVNVARRANADGTTGVVWIQVIESAVNDVIFVALAIAFLTRVESRLKRSEALRSIRTLRSLAHVIDLHQLSKDPLRFHQRALPPTQSSEPLELTQVELERYLQYCVELLSIVGVLAAVHAQELSDPVVVNATGDIEALTLSLSEKIWSKISVSRLASHAEDGLVIPKPTK
jgi:hypothetical protein